MTRMTILCLLVALAPRVHADEAGDAANAKFEQGKRQFRLGAYDPAIALWKEAYTLKGDPVFLFNIAQAYWKKNDLEQAIAFYDSYLKESKDADNRALVEKRIGELRAMLEERKLQAKQPPTEPIPPAGHVDPANRIIAEQPPAAPEPRSGRGLKWAGIATGGVGIVLLATGAAFAFAASSAASDVQNARDQGAPWTADLAARDDAGRRDAALSMITVGVGAAALLGGGVLYLLGIRQERVQVVPQARGLSLWVRF